MTSARKLAAGLLGGWLVWGAAEREAHAGPFKFGLGPMGAFGGNFIDKPDEKNYPDPATGELRPYPPSYPGFGGTTGGFGLAFDARLLGIVGLEVDVLRMTNKGSADMDFVFGTTKYSTEVEIGHDAWHIPVLLKGALPLPLLSPFLIVGAEFVRTSNTVASSSNASIQIFDARSSNYTFFTAGFGFEFKLPIPLPVIDSIRIPVSFRGSYYDLGPGYKDRAELDINGQVVRGVTYDTRWKYQALATLAAQVYF